MGGFLLAQFNLLDTKTVTLNNIFERSGNYKVPDFQRDYSWKEEQWEDLWDDISAIRDNKNPVHYMGAIVLQDSKDKNLTVIDGQQRLATLSIIALAIIKRIRDLVDSEIDEDNNKKRIGLLMTKYIGEKEPVSLHYSKKLTLNENNEQFYSSFLAELKSPPSPRSLSSSDKLLNTAFTFFYKKIKEEFDENSGGEALADLLMNQIAEKLTFIQIVVEDEVNAYTVFETLNSRGIELGTSDLLKNYLLSLTADSDEDKKQAKEQWHRITNLIDLKEFPNFLRYYWHSRYETIRKEQLYKALRNSIKTKVEAFTLLDELEKYSDIYIALSNSNDGKWNENPEIQMKIKELKLFGVRQWIPLLMVSYFNLPIADFSKILTFCSMIAFRYNVIGNLDPKRQERVFHLAAKKVYEKKINSVSKIAGELKSIYRSDEAFSNDFKLKNVVVKKNSKLARYILFSIENQKSGMSLNFETDNGTIEHILPENAPKEWESFVPQNKHGELVNRLGNLTLLETKKNKESGTKPIEDKFKIYKQSQYKMTKEINSTKWTEEEIAKRQEKLANTAKSVWKITQLS